jgi:mono/diheme cytochrome c family protein
VIGRSDINKRLLPPPIFGLLFFALPLVSGCGGDSYPEDLEYPVRTDPLVVTKGVQEKPTGFDKPGELLKLFDDSKNPLLTAKNSEGQVAVQLPSKIKESDREKLKTALDNVFGTPADPRVGGKFPAARAILDLRSATLEKGSKLYRLHCLHCHGLSGDGRGPTAPWVNPHPRDYRQGVFKFTSSKQGEGERKPRRADLERTIREGIEGTSMPSFKLLAEDDVKALASYVIHLSLRGETEFRVMKDLLQPNPDIKSIKADVLDWLGRLANEYWVGAEQEAIAPAEKDYPYKTKLGQLIQPRAVYSRKDYTTDELTAIKETLGKSARNGQKLFRGRGCIGCHYDYGRKDYFLYDAWGTVVRPANLTLGVYRGGHRPIDLFYRVHSGINGSNMAAFGNENTSEIWDVVNFLQVLPYPEMRKEFGIAID